MTKGNRLSKQGWSKAQTELNHLTNLLKPKLTKLLSNVRLPKDMSYERIREELALVEREIIGLETSLRLRNSH